MSAPEDFLLTLHLGAHSWTRKELGINVEGDSTGEAILRSEMIFQLIADRSHRIRLGRDRLRSRDKFPGSARGDVHPLYCGLRGPHTARRRPRTPVHPARRQNQRFIHRLADWTSRYVARSSRDDSGEGTGDRETVEHSCKGRQDILVDHLCR